MDLQDPSKAWLADFMSLVFYINLFDMLSKYLNNVRVLCDIGTCTYELRTLQSIHF
jgi:hypothetical protein